MSEEPVSVHRLVTLSSRRKEAQQILKKRHNEEANRTNVATPNELTEAERLFEEALKK